MSRWNSTEGGFLSPPRLAARRQGDEHDAVTAVARGRALTALDERGHREDKERTTRWKWREPHRRGGEPAECDASVVAGACLPVMPTLRPPVNPRRAVLALDLSFAAVRRCACGSMVGPSAPLSVMAAHSDILTFHDGTWHEGSVPVMRSADHGSWLGTPVFDGARRFDGVAPDLGAHCARVNRSAEALGMRPTLEVAAIVERVREGLERFAADAAVYIRPMYWSTGYGEGFISADYESTDFCLCLQAIPMPPPGAAARLTTTRFTRPTLEVATVDAKASCLYPNNARMMREAIAKGFSNALVTDALGNVAESATSNVFMVRDGEVFTPVPNGTFLNGITRQRVIALLREAGTPVHECTLTLDDFRAADEVFMSGNLAKVTPVAAFEERDYGIGPVTKRAREAYLDWAHTGDPA